MAKKYKSYLDQIEGRLISLDTETTGFNPEEPTDLERKKGKLKDKIVEIGCIEIVDGVRSESFHKYINPERSIPQDATEIHGITDEDVESESKFYQIAEQFIEFVSGSTVVIHNASFDTNFIDHELAHASRKLDKDLGKLSDYCTIVDSLALSRKLNTGGKNTLDALAKKFSVDDSNRDLHGALIDSVILADVYGALLDYQKNHYSGAVEKPYEDEIEVKPLRLNKRPKTVLSM